ncbi:MAG: ComEA family DNA-binding protein [Candidatus Dojkabacteria bacterium]|jgi:competence protein ComEA|nr:ComEA family DNA-binding protein [Candidatus Dojkabacteria bacterium]
MNSILEKNKPLILLFLSLAALFMGVIVLLKIRSLEGQEIVIEKCSGEQDNGTEATIKVDVQGEVKNPGVYEFEKGANIQEAFERAGGLTKKADTKYVDKNLNRAELLIDQQKIFIPSLSEESNASGLSKEMSGNPDKISLNNATLEQLDSLPGIGPSYAQKIIDGRPYKTIEDIKEIKGIGDSTFGKIKDKISL